jgi:hypothetical protein
MAMGLAPLAAEFAFDCCLQHGLAVALELFEGCFQGSNGGVEVGEESFECFHDTLLLAERRYRYKRLLDLPV